MAKQVVLSGLLLTLLLSFSHAQVHYERISYLSVADGLSHNTVNAILKDSRGFMWFGTQQGLNRFDGYNFTVYLHNPNNGSSISNNRIYSIAEDSNGNIWIGTGNGLNKYDRTKDQFERFYLTDDSGIPLMTFVKSLSLDHEENLWIGTLGSGLYQFKPATAGFYKALPADTRKELQNQSTEISSVLVDSRQRIWFTDHTAGINQFDPLTQHIRRFPFFSADNAPDNLGKTLYEDHLGNIWACTEGNGLFRLIEPENTFFHFHSESAVSPLSGNIVRDIQQDDNGLYYIATDGGGVNIYDPASKRMDYLTYDIQKPNALSGNGVYSIYIDYNSIRWIGTFGTGINIVNPNQKQFEHYLHSGKTINELSHPVLWGFYETNDGKIWIGTDGGGVNIFDPQTRSFFHYKNHPDDPTSLGSNVVIEIYQDSRGRIWLGTYDGGLNLYNPRSGSFTRFTHEADNPTSINSNDVWSVYEDRDGLLWVGTLDGLNLFDPERGTFAEIPIDIPGTDQIYSRKITSILEDSRGNLWLGGAWLGLLNKEIKEVYIFSGYSLSGYDISDIMEDTSGNIWIATEGGGLARYDHVTGGFELFTMEDGLPGNMLQQILEDEQGYLWISSSMGLSRFDPSDNSFRNYDRYDGLQGNQFSPNSALKASNGKLYFGGVNGFNAFYPRLITDNTYVPPVYITGLQLMNQPIQPGIPGFEIDGPVNEATQITLKHYQSVITFEFAALNFTSPEKNQYAYMLEGFDNDWNYSGNKKTATYTNLNTGKYLFRVKASNNDGVWNEAGTSVQLIVLPPWWRTWWAYLLYSLIIAAALIYLRNYSLSKQKLQNALLLKDVEKRKIEELNQLKLKFFTNISHEFRTPLTLITGPIERLVSKPGIDSYVAGQLKVVHKNAGRLSKLINQIMDFRKIESGKMTLNPTKQDLVAFVKDIIEAFEQVATEYDIRFEFESCCNEINMYFDVHKMDAILYNLLSNAFKFTPAGGTVTVSIKKDEIKTADINNENRQRVMIFVKDTGIGIPPREIDRIFDRFYQVNDTSRPGKTMEQQGTGIGLSLIREFTELHRGSISVISDHGKGSEFILELPLTEDDRFFSSLSESETVQASTSNTSEPGEEKEIERSEDEKYKTPVILVAEDNMDMQHFIKDILSSQYQVLLAANGKEGYETAAAEIPDLIISDVMMPVMDGFEMAEKIKNDEKTNHIPIIFLSAVTTEESNLHGLKLGAEDYIEKPFHSEALLAKITNRIKNRTMLQEKIRKEVLMQPKAMVVESAEEKFIAKAIEIIEENISNPDLDVKLFCREMGMSRSVLYRKMEAITGQSVGELIRSVRLKRAADLLVSSKLSVSEICYQVGFNDPQYFSKSFKKVYGLSPSKYTQTVH